MAESIDLKDRAFGWYLEHPLATLRDVAIEFEIPYDTVRDWSSNEGWVNRRAIKENTSDDKVVAQAGGIRDVLYETIVGDVSTSALVELVRAWKSITDIKPPKQEEEFYDRDSLLE